MVMSLLCCKNKTCVGLKSAQYNLEINHMINLIIYINHRTVIVLKLLHNKNNNIVINQTLCIRKCWNDSSRHFNKWLCWPSPTDGPALPSVNSEVVRW